MLLCYKIIIFSFIIIFFFFFIFSRFFLILVYFKFFTLMFLASLFVVVFVVVDQKFVISFRWPKKKKEILPLYFRLPFSIYPSSFFPFFSIFHLPWKTTTAGINCRLLFTIYIFIYICYSSICYAFPTPLPTPS